MTLMDNFLSFFVDINSQVINYFFMSYVVYNFHSGGTILKWKFVII